MNWEIYFLLTTNVITLALCLFLNIRMKSYQSRVGNAEILQRYYKMLADKFIRLNNQSLDQLDKIIDKRKFNGTKHAKR